MQILSHVIAEEAELAACVDAEAVLAVQKMNIDHCFLDACAQFPRN
jgi:hypothetical protein